MGSKYVIYVSPYEWGLVEPVKTISEYIRDKLKKDLSEVSDHQIARMFPVLEDLVQGREMKATAIARIMELFERHFGFADSDERERVEEAVGRLVDRLLAMRAREPLKVFKLVRSLRSLLIGFVRGRILHPVAVYEKQSEKGG